MDKAGEKQGRALPEGLIMNEQLSYQLLKIIKQNGDIWSIIDQGYEFGQLTHFIDALYDNGYVSLDKNARTVVTPAGKTFIRHFEFTHHIGKFSKWTLPRSEMWREPLPQDRIYIPKD